MGGRTIAEAGFDWEESVFSGTVRILSTDMMVEESPSPFTVHHYLRTGSNIVVYGELKGDYGRCWRAPATWVYCMFETQFWITSFQLRVRRL